MDIDTEAIAWATQKLQAFGVHNSTMDNALMLDRLYLMLNHNQESINADQQRYQHLRSGKSIHHEFSPCILNRNTMIKVRGKEADLLIDNDLLDTKVYELHNNNEIVERDLLPEGVERSIFDENYCRIIEEVAMRDLQFSEERIAAIKIKNG